MWWSENVMSTYDRSIQVSLASQVREISVYSVSSAVRHNPSALSSARTDPGVKAGMILKKKTLEGWLFKTTWWWNNLHSPVVCWRVCWTLEWSWKLQSKSWTWKLIKDKRAKFISSRWFCGRETGMWMVGRLVLVTTVLMILTRYHHHRHHLPPFCIPFCVLHCMRWIDFHHQKG